MSGKVAPETMKKEIKPNIVPQWKLCLSEFLNDTSLHGCKRIIAQQQPIARLFWMVMVLVMTGILIYSLVQLYIQYHQYKVVTRVTKEIRTELPFPTVVICNRNIFDVESRNLTQAEHRFLQRAGDIDVLLPPVDWNGTDGDELNQVDYPVFWEQASSTRDMVMMMVFKGRVLNPKADPGGMSRGFGHFCFSFNSPSLNSDEKVETVKSAHATLSLMIDVKQHKYVRGLSYDVGVKIYFYDAETAHMWESDTSGVGIGSSVTVGLQRKEISFMGHPYNSRGADCIDVKAPDFVNPLKWYRNYSYSGCISECGNTWAMEKCNCTAAWQPLRVDVNYRNCSIKEVTKCYATHFDNAVSSNRCSCLYPCEMVSFDTQTSSQTFPSEASGAVLGRMPAFPSLKYMRKNMLVVHVKYNSMVVDKAVHEPELLFGDMFGRLGGQMGLFLGASLITISEFLHFLIICIWKTAMTLLWSTASHKPQG